MWGKIDWEGVISIVSARVVDGSADGAAYGSSTGFANGFGTNRTSFGMIFGLTSGSSILSTSMEKSGLSISIEGCVFVLSHYSLWKVHGSCQTIFEMGRRENTNH